MNYKEFYCTLPISENNVHIIDGIVRGDTANIVHVTLMDGSEPFDFSGCSDVLLRILKPDGTKVVAVAASDSRYNIDNPYAIHVSEPKAGRVSFTLKGQATMLTGTHFAQLTLLGDGNVLTTARINYRVGESLYELDSSLSDIVSEDEYAGILNVIRQCSVIISSETDRRMAEELRLERDDTRAAEDAEREARMAQIAAQAEDYFANAERYVELTRTYKELAWQYVQLAKEPSKEVLDEILQGMEFATQEFVQSAINAAITDESFDAGAFIDEGMRLLQVRRGSAKDLPILSNGEFGLSEDTGEVHIGCGGLNVPLTGVYTASEAAPARTDLLWIDTTNSAIKYHDGMEWKSTAAATFA